MTLSKNRPVIAAIDDEEKLLASIRSKLNKKFEVLTYSDPQKAVSEMDYGRLGAVVLDIMMSGLDGLEVLKKIKEADPTLAVVMLTALNDSRNATAALKAGAYDYIDKPKWTEELSEAIEGAIEKTARARSELPAKSIPSSPYFGMIGDSEPMKALYSNIEAVSHASSPVMITGETGAGKELVAAAVHKSSRRASGPFMAINCAAIPESLFESELFGHEKGSFTGALERQTGKFELADGGTLFLDEIACLPLAVQAKLLRALQQGEVMRIGGQAPVKVDVRVVCAANTDLRALSEKGSFRQDLYFRLSVIPVEVPPLRERQEDIHALADHFLRISCGRLGREIKGFTAEAVEVLKKYPWPGNVRELENVVERTAVMTRSETIGVHDIPQEIIKGADSKAALDDAKASFEASRISEVLEQTGGNKTQAAKLLKIDRSTLLSKIKKYSIN